MDLVFTHECECGKEIEHRILVVQDKKRKNEVRYPLSFVSNIEFNCPNCEKRYFGEIEIFDEKSLGF